MGLALVLIALACAVLGCRATVPVSDPGPAPPPGACSDLDLPAGAVCPPRDGGPDALVAVPPRAETWARR